MTGEEDEFDFMRDVCNGRHFVLLVQANDDPNVIDGVQIMSDLPNLETIKAMLEAFLRIPPDQLFPQSTIKH